MSRYQINPGLIPQRQQGPLGALANFGMQQGLKHGLNAAFPGGGFAADAAMAVAPTIMPRFNEGGNVENNWSKMMRQWQELKQAMQNEELQNSMSAVKQGLSTQGGQQQLQRAMLPLAAQAYRNMGGPLGGGQTKEGLKEARALGALSQAEYLKAMKHAGYLNEGGGIHIKPENKGKFTAKASAKGKGVQEYARQVLANKDNYSPATVKQANFARNAAAWHKADGGRIGPLSKTVHKTSDGESMEMSFHNPLAGGNNVGEK